jgi:hypothetical protein
VFVRKENPYVLVEIMQSSLLVVEAPALRGAVAKLFGEAAVAVIASDYEQAAAHGGNVEVGLVREEGVSYNKRIARLSLLALDEGGVRSLSDLRAVMWSTIIDVEALDTISEGEVRAKAVAVRVEEESGDTLVNAIRAVIALDTIRHLHMTTLAPTDKLAYIESEKLAALLRAEATTPPVLKVKLQHAMKMQRRLIETVEDGGGDG